MRRRAVSETVRMPNSYRASGGLGCRGARVGCRGRRSTRRWCTRSWPSSSPSSTPARRASSAKGWDNSVWASRTRGRFAFRAAQIAIPVVERELTVLPRLAPLLPVPIPVPRFVGTPSDRFPWPFFGAALLPGREPADAALTDDERVEARVCPRSLSARPPLSRDARRRGSGTVAADRLQPAGRHDLSRAARTRQPRLPA